MRRFVGALAVLALVLASCGGSTPDGGGGGGGGGGAGADLPAPSTVIFGSAFDPASFTVSGKTGTLKQGTTPIVAVARIFTARPASEVTVTVGSGSRNFAARPVTASNNPQQADIFAFDLSGDNLGPGTWVVDFTAAGRIVASGFLVVAP